MDASSISQDPGELELIRRAGEGDAAGLEGLLERYRPRLRRMIKLRLDRRLQGRVDPSDVIQEAYLDVSRKLAQHLGVQARDAGREVSLHRGPLPEATSAALAAQLIGRRTTPSQAAARAELR